ncbi:MAG: hypothetical protein RLN89_14150 [Parvibaculum sp.]
MSYLKHLYVTREGKAVGLALAALLGMSAPVLAVDNSHNPALPQFEVEGTDMMLHNSVRAEEVTRAVADAKAALAKCDKYAWDYANQWITRIRFEAKGSDGGNGGIGITAIRDRDGADAQTLNGYLSKKDQQWATRCADKEAEADDKSTSLTAGGSIGVGQLSLPQQVYLGLEAAGTLIQTLGVIKTDDDARATAGTFEATASFPDAGILGSKGLWSGVGYVRTTASASSSFTNFDPAGNGLLIPGPRGGTSGFALPSAGGLNVLTQADYEAYHEWDSAYAKFGLPYDCGEWLIMPFFGVAYTNQEQTARFAGNIPGFARSFAYNTMVDVETISPLIGFDVIHHLDRVSLHGGGLVSADFNDADGTDRLSFTGFADSQTNLSKSDTSFGARAWAGVTFGAPNSPFKLSLDLSYVYVDNVPVVTRDGINPSRLGFDTADGVFGTLRTTFRF